MRLVLHAALAARADSSFAAGPEEDFLLMRGVLQSNQQQHVGGDLPQPDYSEQALSSVESKQCTAATHDRLSYFLRETMKKRHHRRNALLPGNAKHRVTTELPSRVALISLDTDWLDLEHIRELQMMGLLWSLITGEPVGTEILERIAVIVERQKLEGRLCVLEDEVKWLRETLPPIIDAITAAPNHVIAAAIEQAQGVVASLG